jgi:hypothetical protein
MADIVRNIDSLLAAEAIANENKGRLDLLKIKAGLIIHADASPVITTPAATILSDTITLANACQGFYNTHIASACDATLGTGIHMAADATDVSMAAVASDQGTVNTLLNDIKTQFNAHLLLATTHPVTDTTNTIVAANATTLGTSVTLANACKTALNAHFAMAMNTPAVTVVAP